MTEFYDITTDLKNALINSPFVNTVTTGGLEDVDLNKKTIFPLSHIIVNSAIPKKSTVSFNISIIAMDIVDESKESTTNIFVGNDNEQDVLNTQLQVLLRISKEMTNGQLFSELIQVIGEPTCEPFTDRFENKLAGWTMTFDVEIPNEMTICGDSIPSSCANAFIQNSDGSFSSSLLSGSTTILDDVRIYVYDQNENLLGTQDSPSNINVNVTVEVPPAEVNAEVVNSLDEIVTTALLTPTNNQISAPNGHSHIKKSGGGNIDNIAIPSGATIPTTIADSVITLKDSGGSNISVTNVQATDTANITAPDGAITVNGTSVGSVKSNGTRALLVKLNGTNSGTYDGVDTINVTATDAWVRPSGWLALDTVGIGTQNFSGLFAVYENQKNVCTINITFPSGTKVINWGDGTTTTASSATLYTKVYDYATLSSPILTDEFGYNYKMAVVNIPLTGTTQLYIDRNTTATLINNGRSLNWLDVAVDCSTMTTFILSNQGIANKLQRLLIYNVGATFDGSGYFQQLVHLRVLKFPFEKLQSSNITFINYFGDVKDENNNPLNIILSINTASLFNLFSNSLLTKLGNISAPTSTSGQSMFENSLMLHTVGTISLPIVANLVAMFSACVNLESVVNITITSTCTSITNLGSNARKCKGFIISNCAGITTTTNAFFNMVSMETLILTGMTRGFTIDDCNMSATAIDALFTSLGTAFGSQTINVRRNPGSATCNTSIATAKGFTVVIA